MFFAVPFPKKGASLMLCFASALLFQGCSNADTGAPTIGSTGETGQTQDRIDTSNLTEADIAAIAKNRKKMSCIELSAGGAQARSLASTATEVVADAGAATESSAEPAKPLPPSNAQLIDEELACHCDRGQATSGNELYERRENLMQLAKYPGIRQELMTHYPKEKGEPRFLRFGELLSDDTLKKLPVVAPHFQSETCNNACKSGRAKDNETAKTQGRPEPWPDLEAPKPVACTAAATTTPKSKPKTTP